MHIIENQAQKVFAGYGTTMSQPLWFTWGQATHVVLFEEHSTAQDEVQTLTEVFGEDGLTIRNIQNPK